VITTAFRNQRAVGVVEMERAGELSGGGFTREAPVAAFLFVAQEINRHFNLPAQETDSTEMSRGAVHRRLSLALVVSGSQ
jgi:hypothetical protein